MIVNTNKEKGNAGLSLAIAQFSCNGQTISIPLNDTQWYDLIVEKEGVFQTVQCKFTGAKDRAVNIISTGGTKGTAQDSMLNHSIDLIFCADVDQNLFVIPMSALREAGNLKSFRLRTERNPNANLATFDTSQFLVQI